MQIHGSRPGKRAASERRSGQRVEIFGEACTLKVVAVKAPDFGDRRKAMLEDMAILTGGPLVW